jgi:hypothetical protein
VGLAQAVQTHFGALSPIILAIPKVEALDDTPLTRQIDDPRLSAVRNASPYWDLFLRAISIPDNYALKVNCATTDSQLDGAVRSR